MYVRSERGAFATYQDSQTACCVVVVVSDVGWLGVSVPCSPGVPQSSPYEAKHRAREKTGVVRGK